MEFPRRITFAYLRRILPTLTSAAEFAELKDELRRRNWRDMEYPSNFVGMMEALLTQPVREEVLADPVRMAAYANRG